MISEISAASKAIAAPLQNTAIQAASPTRPGSTERSGLSNFGDLFRGTINEADKLEQQARTAIEGLMRGNGVDVHDALIAAEKANAAFELTLSMRNKAIQSYQSVMSMQF